MARTAPPALNAAAPPAFTLTPTPAPPAPNQSAPAVQSPVYAWPSPLTDKPAEQKDIKRRRNSGGMPMGPTMIGAGNATTMTMTAALQYGGPVAAAATGVVVAAAATAAALRRRSSVRRSVASRSGNRGATRSGGGGSNRGGLRGATPSGRSGLGSGPGRSGSRSGGSGGGRGATNNGPRSATGGSKPGATPSAKGTGPGSASGPRSATGTGSAATGGGLKNRHGNTWRQHGLAGSGGGKGSHAKPGKSAGLRAAAGRTARAMTKSGSVPRKALTATGRGTVTGLKAAGRATASAGKFAARHLKKLRQTKAAAAVGRQLKKTPGRLLDGSVAVLAGIGTWIWHPKSLGAALNRLRDVWRRRRAKRAAKNTPNPASTTAAAVTVPPAAATVRRPRATTTTSTTAPRGATMSGHHFIAPAMEFARISANYDPHGMLEVGEDFTGLAEALRLHAEGMKLTVENADAKFPLDPRIVDIMRQVHELQLKAADLSDELKPAFERLHDVDLDRLRNPRKGKVGESMWDASTNL